MQQMTNILLSSADASAAKKVSPNSQPELNADGDNFSAALEKASQMDPAPNAEHKNEQGNTDTPSTNATTQNSTVAASNGKAEDAEVSDDVSQVLAQINLANNFPSDAESQSMVAADGETLPLVDDMQIAQEKGVKEGDLSADTSTDLPDEMSDEILQALSFQSGISEVALRNMPAQDLNDLLAQSQILGADGELLSQYAITSAPLTATSASTSTSTDAARAQAVNDDPKLANAVQTGNELTSPTSKADSRDILGKEAAMQAATEQGGTQRAEIEKGVSAKSALGDANNMTAATEQLKGAELSVRLTPIQMGLEANLASGSATLSTEEIKTAAGLQAHNLQIQQSLTRAEPQQIQLSLKQHADQATQMQEMIQRFSPVMKQQLITMVSQGVQHAEIRLDPAELGSMIVRIQVQGDTTQVQFQVSQHQTRDLIEQAMPRLREMLAEQGMQLTDGQVSQDNGGNEQAFQGDRDSQGQSHSEMDEISAEDRVVGTNLASSAASGIDYYA
ncbi:flagellar hook-length control protein FliK [Shewanella sp. Choline-02u-19]|uniref:flagellar hook-length control protein FliK n=1 Tax=unclassified Shewanella TaxID=196818 RepID=UPI000C331115|nr:MULTISPECIES: flagellar hook-length control protein FliK [unclassified Shewanella]PKH55710.1 flagellar hook-length control protein FliK [Shewanella sp. Bg11-22]PKI26875.1 flagellar hook-length control protein FliK [Shewanella sp. Choline-02u-19]